MTKPANLANELPHRREIHPYIGRIAKRRSEAAVWTVALSTPGLLGALSQAGNLFTASSIQWAFGYIFVAMELLFVASIVIGTIVYAEANRIMSISETIDFHVDTAYSYMTWAKAAGERGDEGRGLELLDRADEAMVRSHNLTSTLSDRYGVMNTKLEPIQRWLVVVSYAVFLLLLATSDFSRLL